MPDYSIQKTTYGVCEMAGVKLEFGQTRGHPAQVKGITATSLPEGMEIDISIRTYGKAAKGSNNENCEDNGDEFNPLREYLYDGVPNPYQDPSRGTIPSFTIGADGTATLENTKLLQNLRGKDGILGKSVTFTVEHEGNIVTLGCCIIGESMPPAAKAPAAAPAES